jgi:nitric oxide dioxygenase
VTPQQVKPVQNSFAKVAPIAPQAATLFYDRLFEIEPRLKPLFRGDLDEQKKKLMQMLTVVVNGLDRLETILPAASLLAKKHVGYGVTARDYEPVGAALLWTLETGLGDGWTRDVSAAWSEAYTTLSGFMISEAYPQTRAAE